MASSNRRGLAVPEQINPGAGVGRKQVALAPGHSMMDWMRLKRKMGSKMRGVDFQPRAITPEELAANDGQDGRPLWMSLYGRVFNVTHYVPFHPGGVAELYRGAGQDATQLFAETHAWVNIDNMLDTCLVGFLKPSSKSGTADGASATGHATSSHSGSSSLTIPATAMSSAASASLSPSSNQNAKFAVPKLPGASTSKHGPSSSPRTGRNVAKWDWFQTNVDVVLVLYVPTDSAGRSVLVQPDATGVQIHIESQGKEHVFMFELEAAVRPDSRVSQTPALVRIVLHKREPHTRWSRLGELLHAEQTLLSSVALGKSYQACRITRIAHLTHDTSLYKLIPLREMTTALLPGQHIRLRTQLGDKSSVTRSYTPIPTKLGPVVLAQSEEKPSTSHYTFLLLVKHYHEGALSSQLAAIPEKVDGSASTGVVGVPSFEVSSSPFGDETIMDQLQRAANVVLLAAGTGITPMLGVMASLLDQTQAHSSPALRLVFCNRSEKDIPFREQLDGLGCATEGRATCTHVLSQPSDQWTGFKGRLELQHIMHACGQDSQELRTSVFCLCGPTGFVGHAKQLLQSLGVHTTHVIVFS